MSYDVTCTVGTLRGQRTSQMPWHQSHQSLWPGSWEPSSGPAEEEQIVLAIESSLQHHRRNIWQWYVVRYMCVCTCVLRAPVHACAHRSQRRAQSAVFLCLLHLPVRDRAVRSLHLSLHHMLQTGLSFHRRPTSLQIYLSRLPAVPSFLHRCQTLRQSPCLLEGTFSHWAVFQHRISLNVVIQKHLLYAWKTQFDQNVKLPASKKECPEAEDSINPWLINPWLMVNAHSFCKRLKFSSQLCQAAHNCLWIEALV